MGKNSKIIFLNFSPFECGAVEEHLEIMAEKGWLLQSINGLFLKFKKIKPQKLKYSVDVLSKISEFDHKDSDLAMEYREYCEAAGWKYLCEKGKVQVFYSENYNNTISIHTDEKEKFKSVFKASLYNAVFQLVAVLLFIFNIYMQLFAGGAMYAVASNIAILSVVAMVSVIFMNSTEIISFVHWTIRNKLNLKKSKNMTYNTYKQIQIKNMVRNIYKILILIPLIKVLFFDNNSNKISGVLMLLTIAALIIVPVGIKRFLDKERYSKTTNAIITVSSSVILLYMMIMFMLGLALFGILKSEDRVAPPEKVELTLSDFGYTEKTNTVGQGSLSENPYIRIDESILAKTTRYSDGSENNELFYTICQSEHPWIVNFQKDRLVERLSRWHVANLKLVDTKLPSSVKVYSDDNREHYVVVSKNKVFEARRGLINVEEDKFLEIIYKELFKN
ncbi:DUF2812 domain-containing protein [Clostridium tunisiense]|uniref:DUF2812 domain-containing protein n=1 Tax=Clostridium tunisiense TaxID=219748 RepID=UPI00030F3C7B|nr:DUF2812 domain-containing protein [Clostridium tunisiense]